MLTIRLVISYMGLNVGHYIADEIVHCKVEKILDSLDMCAKNILIENIYDYKSKILFF